MKLIPIGLWIALLFIPALNLPLSALAQEDTRALENISQELVTIRQEISALHDQIKFEKSQFNDQLRAYSNQKSDLEVKLSRAELNETELKQELSRLQEINAEKFKSADEIVPVINDSIAELRTTVSNSLPFKRDDRLQALDEIEHRLETNVISPNKAANQLWAFVEDELILGRSSGIYNETLTIGGEPKLVKVLRLGKLAMFYKTSEDQYGMIHKVNNEWEQKALLSDDSTRQLDELFDSFTKNIRNGQFTIPNYLPQS